MLRFKRDFRKTFVEKAGRIDLLSTSTLRKGLRIRGENAKPFLLSRLMIEFSAQLARQLANIGRKGSKLINHEIFFSLQNFFA